MKTISPAELEALLQTDPDVVDVREPYEWAKGHLPSARLVPLALLRADPTGALPRDNVVFVCAKGGRSAAAAELADAIGKELVYNLAGGTEAWRAAGLPIVVPGPTPPTTTAAAAEVPEPALDAVVGANLKGERVARGWSLDDLAREAGVSRTLLGQIEIGRATPSIGVVWKLAQALGVPFSTLLSTATAPVGTTTSHRAGAKTLTSADGRFSSRALHPLGDPFAAEFYELRLAPHSREDADAHRPGTRENLVITSGRLELHVGRDVLELVAGDAVNFSADVAHSYVNQGHEECWLYLVMNYARDLGRGGASR